MTQEPMDLSGMTLLTEQQIWGDDQGNGQLQVMKAYDTKTGMSDLAIVLGGYMSTQKTSDGQPTGFVWSASSNGYGIVRAVISGGDRNCCDPYVRSRGARPALPSSVTSSIRLSDSYPEALAKGEAISGNPIKDTNGKVIWDDVILFGEYPQTIAPENIGNELEQAFSRTQLKGTGKKYTFDGEEYDAYDTPFSAKEYVEYQHNGKRYIRVEAKPYDENSMLSNGHRPKAGEACWIEVQPIEWLVEPEKIRDYFGNPEGVEIDNPNAGMLVARQALFAGVQFDKNESYDGNFENTDMYHYLNEVFAKDIIPSTKEVAVEDAAPAVGGAAEGVEAVKPEHTRQQKLEQIGIKAGYFGEIVEVDDPSTVLLNDGDTTYLSSGVVISVSDLIVAELAKQLNHALSGVEEDNSFKVSRLSKDEVGNARLHISDAALDKLCELGVKVDMATISRPQIRGRA